ncbi:MAG: substrate-binding domain-containing protein [Planctomycetaceae bacterium]
MRFGILACVLAVAGVIAWYAVSAPDDKTLVVYCAHDLEYSEPILKQFERESGIRVVIVGDTEATKSLGLVQQILREGVNTRCDVFWNNQVLGTVQLKRAGFLETYKGPGYERIPAEFKDPDGMWTGFAGRLRVWIVNTEKLQPTPEAIDAALAAPDLTQMAIAMPMFGTTLSHYSLLWKQMGGEALKQQHHDYLQRGCRVVSGNATVKNLVAEGTCSFGMTDTDDYFVAVDQKRAVAQLPIRVNGRTICIPNSVAIVRGSDNPDAAKMLVDYLLSERIELELAQSKARQIPLGPVAPESVPEDVRLLQEWAGETADMRDLGDAQEECLAWLKAEYAP